jgi:hypothetical protein
MYTEWQLPEEGACIDVTLHINYSGKIVVFTTKGQVRCENGFVVSGTWWKMGSNGKPSPATDCTSGTLMGYSNCSYAEQAKLWSGECTSCPHVNLVRNINTTQYYKMYVSPELQAFVPSCLKGLVTPVVYGTATPVPATFTVTPVAKFAPEKKTETSSFMQSFGSGPILGLCGLLLVSVVVGVRMRMRAVRSPSLSMEEGSDGETIFERTRFLQQNSMEVQALPTEGSDVETSFE